MSFYFTTNKNLLKRDSSTGTATVSAPSTLVGSLYKTEYVITHGLGYIPVVRVYFESVDNGEIYPACGSTISGLAVGITYGGVLCTYELTATTLTIILHSANSQTGTREIYWVIYKDSP